MRSPDDNTSEALRRLYFRDRLSIRQTASVIGMSYQGTRKRLLKVGPLRSKSEGRMKYPRRPFSGEPSERAYLLGLRAGDINAWRKSLNTVEVRVSTTHPAMSRLFARAFSKYGHLMRFAEPAYLPGHFRWQSKAHLDTTFEFLVLKPREVPDGTEEFFRFLGGYSDSECCWSVFPRRNRIGISWAIETQDAHLVRQVALRLKANGFHPLLYWKAAKKSGTKNQMPHGRIFKYTLALRRTDEVVALAHRLMPFSMHAEKITKMRVILTSPRGPWSEVSSKFERLRKRTKDEVEKYKEKAERAYYNRPRKGRTRAGSSASLV